MQSRVSTNNNYPGNSFKKDGVEPNKVSGTHPDVDKIVTGKVVTRKRGLSSKLADMMFSEEAESVGPYILYDIAIPAIKNFIVDSVTQGLNRIMWGAGPRPGGGVGTPVSRVSYDKVYTRPGGTSSSPPRKEQTGGTYVDEFIFSSREEADSVLSTLISIIEDFEVARVADLYGLIGKTASFTDNRWGWTNLSTAQIIRGRDGYIIRLPRAEVIKKN